MNAGAPPENAKFDVTVDPAPPDAVLDAEEDEEAKRKRDAELASTFDPALAHHGKTEEEMIEQRQDEARLLLDAAIAAGIVFAVAEQADNEDAEVDVEEAAPPDEDSGE
jgi:hypothetical protein